MIPSTRSLSVPSTVRTPRTTADIVTPILDMAVRTGPEGKPLLTSSMFDSYRSFLDNVVRMALDSGIKTAPLTPKATTGNDYANLLADPDVQEEKTPGEMLANGSVAHFNSREGDDRITVKAEKVVTDILARRGNDLVSITARWVTDIDGGSGNDVIGIDAESVARVKGGADDDVITIHAHGDGSLDELLSRSTGSGSVSQVEGNKGNDTIDIIADDTVTDVSSGSGRDDVHITAKEVRNVDAGEGIDKVSIAADIVDMVDAGSANDDVTIKGRRVSNISGGDGADRITITHKGTDKAAISLVDGGRGNDTISVDVEGTVNGVEGGDGKDLIVIQADEISHVSGGAGDDRMSLVSRGKEISVDFSGLDGHDDVSTNRDLVVNYSGPKGSGLAGAKLTKIGTDSYRLSFPDSDATMTIHYTPDDGRGGVTEAAIKGNTIVFQKKLSA